MASSAALTRTATATAGLPSSRSTVGCPTTPAAVLRSRSHSSSVPSALAISNAASAYRRALEREAAIRRARASVVAPWPGAGWCDFGEELLDEATLALVVEGLANDLARGEQC